MQPILSSLLAVATAASAASVPCQQRSAENSVEIQGHASYSSSVGVLGCKIDTNRVAYWPAPVSCDDICIRLHANERSVTLLKIDKSTDSHDISYDAWNYLKTGQGARENPTPPEALPVTWENVPMSDPECLKLLKTPDGTLPLSASTSMIWFENCAKSGSWVGQHYTLYNIVTSTCTLGYDETCVAPVPPENRPTCAHPLGLNTDLHGLPVININLDGTEAVAL